MKRLSIYSLLFLLLIPAVSWAQAPRDRWGRLSPEEKAQVERNFQRWQSLPPGDRERLNREWQHWQNLPPDRRQELRQRFEQFRGLPPHEAEQWREKSRQRGLSPDEKRTLRDRLHNERRSR